MSDRTDRTDCPVFELMAVAYHEAGHAIGAVLGSPPLVVELVTIVPDEDSLGLVTYEDWHEHIVLDADEDAEEISEHERQYLRTHDIVSTPGAMTEAMLRSGRPECPDLAGTGFD
jgi:hypothetical protein